MTLRDQLTDGQRELVAAQVIEGLVASAVPEHLRGGLVRYFSDGILPGSFLQAVLCNDFRQAIGRADPVSLRGLYALAMFLAEHVPARAWGSRDAVLAWTTTPDRLEI